MRNEREQSHERTVLLITSVVLGVSALTSLITLAALGKFARDGDPKTVATVPCALAGLKLSNCSISVTTLCGMEPAEFNAASYVCVNADRGMLAKGTGVNISSFVKGYYNVISLTESRCLPERVDCEHHVCCYVQFGYELCTVHPAMVCRSTGNLSAYQWAVGRIVGCVTAGPGDICVGCAIDCELFVYGNSDMVFNNYHCLGNRSYHFNDGVSMCPGSMSDQLILP